MGWNHQPEMAFLKKISILLGKDHISPHLPEADALVAAMRPVLVESGDPQMTYRKGGDQLDPTDFDFRWMGDDIQFTPVIYTFIFRDYETWPPWKFWKIPPKKTTRIQMERLEVCLFVAQLVFCCFGVQLDEQLTVGGPGFLISL